VCHGKFVVQIPPHSFGPGYVHMIALLHEKKRVCVFAYSYALFERSFYRADDQGVPLAHTEYGYMTLTRANWGADTVYVGSAYEQCLYWENGMSARPIRRRDLLRGLLVRRFDGGLIWCSFT
jgi:hypothetical protein